MATVVLGAVGAGVGAAFGNPMMGFSVGVMLAGVLFPPKTAAQERGRLDDLRLSGSAYGAPIPQVYGANTVGMNIIWAKKDANGNHLVEHVADEKAAGKGTSRSTGRVYTYSASWASYVCRGPIGRIKRIWAEDRLIFDNGDAVSGEVQEITRGTNTGGAFTVEFRGDTSASILWNDTGATIQGILEGLPSIGVGNILVTGASGGPWTCTFTGTLAGQDLPRMDMSNHTLTGGSGDGIHTVQQGGTQYNITTYLGTEAQVADSFMETAEGGAGSVPAYRGTAYVVFQDFPLQSFGNRIPAMRFEVDNDGDPVTVGDVLTSIFEQCGLTTITDFDVSASIQEITGFTLAQRTSGADAIRPLVEAYFFDVAEFDGIIQTVNRGGAVAGTLPARHLGSYIWTGRSSQPKPKVQVKRMQDVELPWHIDYTYFEVTNLYGQATQGASRITKSHIQNVLTINHPIVHDADTARQIAERTLYQQWTEREQFTFIAPFQYILYAPSDIVYVPVGSNLLRVRIVGQDIALTIGPTQFQGVLDDEDILVQSALGGVSQITSIPAQAEDTTLIAWSGNAMRDADTLASGVYLSANSVDDGDWPGCTIYWSRDGGLSYQILDTITDPGLFGYVVGVVPAPSSTIDTGAFDDVTTVTVVMTHGVPSTTTDDDVLNGANCLLIGNEIIQYGIATPTINDNEYELTHLLRGRRGTDGNWSSHTNGELAMMLNVGAVIRENFSEDVRSVTVYFKAVTFGDTLANTPAVPCLITGNEWKEYAVCHIIGTRLVGDLTVVWVRRSRAGAELHDYVDVDDPDAEEYEVDIYNGVSIVRSFTGLSSATFTYTSAQQVTDFGSPQPSIHIIIYRIGRYGRGYPASITV